MSAHQSASHWSEDPDLAEWLFGVMLHRPVRAGRFLTSIAASAKHADWSNYQLMRPLLLELREKYPKFAAKLAQQDD